MKPQKLTAVVKNPRMIILSQHKINIMQKLADDVPQKLIAKELGITYSTVQSHLCELKKQFGLKSVTALAIEMHRQKLIK